VVINWLPDLPNAFLQKKGLSCIDDNERDYLIILPCTLGSKPAIYKEMGIYSTGLTQPQSEYRVATSTKIMGDASSSNPGGDSGMYIQDDMATNNNTTNLGTITDNTTDAMIKEASPLDPKPLSHIYDSADMKVGQDVSNWLARPYLLCAGSLNASDGVTPVFRTETYSVPLGTDVYLSKIKGFVGFRATTVFTIVLNATRFQQGRYIMAFIPVGGLYLYPDSDYVKAHTYSLKQWTQLPHVEFDVNCDTQAVLRIPYIHSEPMFSLIHLVKYPAFGMMGELAIRAYSAIDAVTGSTSAGFTLYVHYEDVELFGPTQPQSNFKPKGRGTASEKELDQRGTLSTVLLQGSNAAGVLARIPLISSFASTASWALDIASSAAWAFGLSKPTNIETICKMQTFRQPFMNNIDGANNILPLSLQTKYGVEALPGFAGNDFDEMSFDYMKTIFSYQWTEFWLTSTTPGTDIFAVNLTPTIDNLVIVEGITTTYNVGPMGLMAQQFNNWRGGISLRLKFVKTEFHSGRLLVTYCPVDARIPAATSNYNNQVYLMKRIIDVRDTNEVTITFPYVQTRNYVSVEQSVGQVAITVLDQLQAPATVKSQITILIEVAAAPDFEVFNPKEIFLLPYLPGTPQSNWDPPGCIEESTVIGGGVISVSDSHSRACVGEKITSFRQLCKFWGFMLTDPPVAGSVRVSYSPFVNPSCKYSSLTTPPTQGGNLADWISILSHGYMFSRGSVVIAGYNADLITGIAQSYDISLTTTMISDGNSDLFAYTLPAARGHRGKPYNTWDYNQAGYFAFNCPAWSKSISRCNSQLYEVSNPLLRDQSTLPDYRVQVFSSASGTWSSNRAAGEDFTMGGYIGFGPFIVHA